MNLANIGRIIFFTGCMFAEKGAALVRESKRARHAWRPKCRIRYFRPAGDTNSKRVRSRVGLSVRAETLPADIDEACALLREAFATPGIVAIDEVQLLYVPKPGEALDPAKVALFMETILRGARDGSQIFLSGLDADFRGEPFPISAALLLDPRVFKRHLTAVCSCCLSDEATMTQRLVGGRPATRSEPTVIIKGTDARKRKTKYEPRCVRCYVPPI